jgi:diguanylate cyclase (GGDEF)-like protein/PAS domain S-box-containing protein
LFPVITDAQAELPVALMLLDKHWRIAEVNTALMRLFAVEQDEIVGRQFTELLPVQRRGTVMERLARELTSKGRAQNFAVALSLTGQNVRHVILNATAQFDADGGFNGAVAAISDVTALTESEADLMSEVENITSKLAEVSDYRDRIVNQSRDLAEIAENGELARDEVEQALSRAEESEKRFRTIVTSVADGILVINQQGTIQLFNHAAEKIFGISVVECIGKNIESLIADNDGTLNSYLGKKFPGRERYRKELRGLRKDGVEFPMELTANATSFDETSLFVVICRDISNRKQAQEKLESLAKYDPLTGLANRTLFHEKLDEALRLAERGRHSVAVLYLDLDHFKDINDTLGHPAGDQLLKLVAASLKKCVRGPDTVARLGGDEFAIIATNVNDQQLVHRLAGRIVEVLKEPVVIQSQTIHTGTSIGITLYPDDAVDPDRLMKNADLALYRAKSNGRDRFEFYHREMNEQIVARMQMENELRAAIADNELSLHYQPQADIETGTIIGVEALIRWKKKNGDMVPPDQFIPIAEACGLMRQITDWVLKEAVQQCKDWQTSGQFTGRIGVNLSPTDLKHPDLAPSVMNVLKSVELDSTYLELEITEGMMIEQVDAVIENLRQFRDNGIGVAIDDFGTGYSSLSYLRRFSVDRVKIDRSFVNDINDNRDVLAITEAIISMGHALGLKVIAEGVETEAQLELLRRKKCDEFQGYLFARPMPPAEFIEFAQTSVARNKNPSKLKRA